MGKPVYRVVFHMCARESSQEFQNLALPSTVSKNGY